MGRGGCGQESEEEYLSDSSDQKKKNQQKTTFTKWAYVTHFFAKNNKKAWAIVLWAVNFTIKKEDIMDIVTLL